MIGGNLHEKRHIPNAANLALIIAFLTACLICQGGSVTGTAKPVQELQPGVAVEKTQNSGEASKAGIQEGDILLSWAQADRSGALESPFDLVAVEIEQKPKGSVTLQGLRDTQKQIWHLGTDIWGIQARPLLPEALQAPYREAQDFAKAGNWAQTLAHWRTAMKQEASPEPARLSAWLFSRAAETLAEARQWSEADQAFQEAVQSTAEASIKAHVWRAWGKTFEQRSDWAHAEKCYKDALESAGKPGLDDLTHALDLSSLGNIARVRSDLPRAEEYFQQAFAIRTRLAAGSLVVAASLHDLGTVAFYRSDLVKAEDYFRQGLAIRERLAPSGLDVAASFTGLGTVANYRGDQVKAEEYYRRSLEIRERLAPNSIDVAKNLTGLGNVAYDRGDLNNAEEYFRKSYVIREKLGPGSLDVAGSLMSLGNVVYDRGDLLKAQQYYDQAFRIREKVAPGSLEVAKSLVTSAFTARDRGDLIKAEADYRLALEIQQKLAPDSLDVSVTLNNLAIVYFVRGDLAKAEEYYKRSLSILKKIAPDSLNMAHRFTNLGRLAWARGNLDEADQYLKQSLAIKEKQSPGSLTVAATLNYLGEVAANRHDWPQAEDFYQRALRIHEKLAPRGLETAVNLNSLGALARDRGDLLIAQQYYTRALEIWDKLAPASMDQAETLAALGAITRQQGQLEAAAQFFQRALSAIESQTARLGGSQEIRAGFRGRFERYYKDDVDLLIAMGRPELAFQVLESSRARTLLETLVTANVDIHRGGDPALLEQEHSLQADINAKSERRIRLISGKDAAGQLKTVEKEISDLQAEYRNVQAQIRSSSPGYAALTQPRTLTAQEIQQRLLDPGTVLLEYSLGERSYVFAVTSSSLTAYELPKRSEIEAVTRRVHELLSTYDRVAGQGELQRQQSRARDHAQYVRASGELSRMVLAPVAALIRDKRILVVADGALQYVPFAALPDPETLPGHGVLEKPLIVDHEIVYLPSASVLDVLRREALGRKPASRNIAVLADPVFDDHDPRVSSPKLAPRSVSSSLPSHEPAQALRTGSADPEQSFDHDLLTRSAEELGMSRNGKLHLSRLLFSRYEAEAILAAVPSSQSMRALDFHASRTTATNSELSQYRIIHFATHGLLNSEHPELSGLVLSLVDKDGKPQNGFLQLQDIYNLHLPADLVVLSACETALGKEISGEGLVGLTRGFMYAGASRVVASLWKVSDVATAKLMAEFYRAMEKDGMPASAALRAAQIKMWKQKRWNEPYYWAAFQIQGEWK